MWRSASVPRAVIASPARSARARTGSIAVRRSSADSSPPARSFAAPSACSMRPHAWSAAPTVWPSRSSRAPSSPSIHASLPAIAASMRASTSAAASCARATRQPICSSIEASFASIAASSKPARARRSSTSAPSRSSIVAPSVAIRASSARSTIVRSASSSIAAPAAPASAATGAASDWIASRAVSIDASSDESVPRAASDAFAQRSTCTSNACSMRTPRRSRSSSSVAFFAARSAFPESSASDDSSRATSGSARTTRSESRAGPFEETGCGAETEIGSDASMEWPSMEFAWMKFAWMERSWMERSWMEPAWMAPASMCAADCCPFTMGRSKVAKLVNGTAPAENWRGRPCGSSCESNGESCSGRWFDMASASFARVGSRRSGRRLPSWEQATGGTRGILPWGRTAWSTRHGPFREARWASGLSPRAHHARERMVGVYREPQGVGVAPPASCVLAESSSTNTPSRPPSPGEASSGVGTTEPFRRLAG